MAAIAPVRTETAPRRSRHFCIDIGRRPHQPSIRPLASGDVAWKTAQRFPLVGTAAISGQGFAVVHATGYGLRAIHGFTTRISRLANRPVQKGERQCPGGVEPKGCGERPTRAMDGPCRPTPERRWRERNVAQRSNSRRLARRASNASHLERSGGPDVWGKRFCLLLSGTRSPGRVVRSTQPQLKKVSRPGGRNKSYQQNTLISQGNPKPNPGVGLRSRSTQPTSPPCTPG